MSKQNWTVYYYTTTSGKSPIRDFIDTLSPKDRARIKRGLRLLEEFGPPIGMPHVKPLQGKLWELLIRGKRAHRILWFVMSEQTIVFLHVFTKKQDKIPPRHMNTALRRMQEIEKRYGGEQQ